MVKRAHFTPALFTFLGELRLHNDRDWFAQNRERYLRDVRDPMLRFIADFAPVLRKMAPSLVADPRPVGGSLFRLNRDTRFSRDKSPYKTNVAAHFRHQAGRDVHGPGYYLSLEPDAVTVGGGVWHPEADALRKIRRSVVTHPEAWRKAERLQAREGLEWWGDTLARTPRGFPSDHPLEETLRRKDFAAGIELGEREALSPGFLGRCADVYRTLLPVMKLLARGQGLSWRG